MHYTVYQKSRNLSWEILINEGIHALPVKMGELCRSLGIRVITHAGEIDSCGDGKAGIVDGQPIIFVNTETSPVFKAFRTHSHRKCSENPSPKVFSDLAEF